jgi:toxin ParE1/3/4
MKKVIYRPRALLDVVEIASYLAIEATEDVADRFQGAVQETASTVANMSGMGTLCAFHHPLLKNTRRIPVTGFENWLLFYRDTEDRIDVIRVLHGAQDIVAIFEEDT